MLWSGECISAWLFFTEKPQGPSLVPLYLQEKCSNAKAQITSCREIGSEQPLPGRTAAFGLALYHTPSVLSLQPFPGLIASGAPDAPAQPVPDELVLGSAGSGAIPCAVEFVSEPKKEDWGVSAIFKDSEGNRFVLSSR